MKNLLTILLLITASSLLFSQITGTTQTGKLIFNKEKAEQNTDITPPQILLLEPNLSDGRILNSEEEYLEIKGNVKDNYGLKTVSVNGVNVELSEDNQFETRIKLAGGNNTVSVKAVNIKDKSDEITFIVDSKTDKDGPYVIITEPVVSRGIKIIRKSEVITVRGFATDISGVIDVTVNNQKPSLASNGEFAVDLYLAMGDNKIVVKAIDSKLNTTVDTFTVTRKLEDVITAGKYVALVIGINSYSGYWPPLRNAVNDAKGIAEILKKDYLFSEVRTILDKDATRRNIIHEFEDLTRSLTKDDNLLIFYAGHGQFNKALNKGYWVPVDATSNSVADYISNNDVKTFLGGIPTKHTLLVTDACFSGDIFRGTPTQSLKFDPNNMERYYREVYRKQSRLALTSGGIEEVMDSGKDNHSIFTYYLLKALQENQQKYLDAQQLFNEFRVAVTNNSEQTPMLQVVRDTDDEGGQFVFIRKDK